MAASVAVHKKKVGRPAHITAEVVERVSKRVGIGLTVKQALECECDAQINEGSWKTALARNPNFVTPFQAAKGKFLEQSFTRLSVEDDWRALVVLLERRHSLDFVKQTDKLEVKQVISGLPDDILAAARDYAAKQIPENITGS